MIESLNNSNSETEDYLKLVYVNFDGASVMSGHVSGVQQRMMENVPGLLYTHCVAHVLELAMLDSMKFEDT